MFDFLKKKNDNKPEEQPNDFLSVENSVLNTESEPSNSSLVDNFDYSSLVYQEPVYDVPLYKASNLSNMGVVLDSDAIGFDKSAINPDIKTVEYEKKDSIFAKEVPEKPNVSVNTTSETIDLIELEEIKPTVTEPIKNNVVTNSIFDKSIQQPLNEPIVEPKDDDVNKFTIFGSIDGVTDINNYSHDNHFVEDKKELIKEVEYTKDGYKICPNCGAILNPSAAVCFMCSKSFVLKK